MDGVGGKPAWAWIFIIEGLATIVLASVSVMVIQDFPTDARFLTEDESEQNTHFMRSQSIDMFHCAGVYVISRLQADQQFSASGEPFSAKYILDCLKDKKTLIGCTSL